VCVPGSVEVPGLLEVEAHPTVWQLVSTVEGQLAPGTSWASLLRATFPCGSVTGTPKVRAMQLIEQLEPVRRGWYCGAIGLLGAGHAALSVAIRTAVLDGGCVDYAAGGGIVADSDIDAEYEETLAKAAAFLGAVGADEVAP
jgi:para-aminobenzoate synthetase component 1